MLKTAPLPLATIDAPIGWRVSSEIVMTEEVQRGVKTPMHPGLDAPQSPAILSLTRDAIDPKGFKLERALNNFIGELADMSEKFELLEEKPFDFDDGVKGLASLVRFEMGPGQVCTQRYVLRVDGDVASRFCISLDARRAEKMKDLEQVVRSFRLLTDKT